ncbi:MAG: hypothetical protein ACRDUW_01560 [Pseudonocardiaceae bacterium]
MSHSLSFPQVPDPIVEPVRHPAHLSVHRCAARRLAAWWGRGGAEVVTRPGWPRERFGGVLRAGQPQPPRPMVMTAVRGGRPHQINHQPR